MQLIVLANFVFNRLAMLCKVPILDGNSEIVRTCKDKNPMDGEYNCRQKNPPPPPQFFSTPWGHILAPFSSPLSPLDTHLPGMNK